MFKKFLFFIFFILVIISGIYMGINDTKDTSKPQTEKDSLNTNDISNNISGETVNEEIINDEIINELFGEYYEKAEKLMADMTIEEKVGQMFLARYPKSGVIEEITAHQPGGYVLFGGDFNNETPETISEKLKANQDASKINLILGVDEEGGSVVRVSLHKAFRDTKFLSPQALWNLGGLQKILEDSIEKSKLLKSLGLNMNLAPVVDIPENKNSFIYSRSYGKGTEETAVYTEELIKTMNESNMISVMKHFPGYGDNVDTHTGIAIDTRSYENFENADFIPFKKGIEAGAPCILVSHNVVNCIDDQKPASLSENTINILRKELNFSGIIMTDDLAMAAVKTYVENGEAAVQAVLAGNDMIISSDFATQKAEILSAIKDGRISEEIINTAVRRILAFKYAYSIINDTSIKNDILTLQYHGGSNEPEDTVKWSYEIDLNAKKTTEYCSSTGLLIDEELIKKYGYDKKITRSLSEDEFNNIMQILNQPDNYKYENYNEPRFILYSDNIRLCIPLDDSNSNAFESITNNY